MAHIDARARGEGPGGERSASHDLSEWHEQTNARIYAGYLLLQAGVGIVQWMLVFESATFRSWFEVVDSHRDVMNAFAVADLCVIVSSIISAWGVAARRAWAPVMVAFTAATLIYPTLWLIGWVMMTDGGGSALLVMIAPTTITTWIAVLVWRARPR